MRYEPPRRWLLGPASSNGDGLGHSPAWLIGPSGAILGRRPDYSITSSASAIAVGGTVKPSVIAVLRLMANSNLAGACAGSSAGLAPFKMRSTYEAERQKRSDVSGPYDIRPTRLTAGATFLSSSSDFPNMVYSKKVKPVTLPPGRARLEIKPSPTGSFTSTKTIGIEWIICTASERIGLAFATMMSGGCAASSLTSLRMRSTSPAVQYQSMRRFFPSVQPRA